MHAVALFVADLVLTAVVIAAFVRARELLGRLRGDGSDGDGGQRWRWHDQPRHPRLGPHTYAGRTQPRVPSRPRSRA